MLLLYVCVSLLLSHQALTLGLERLLIVVKPRHLMLEVTEDGLRLPPAERGVAVHSIADLLPQLPLESRELGSCLDERLLDGLLLLGHRPGHRVGSLGLIGALHDIPLI